MRKLDYHKPEPPDPLDERPRRVALRFALELAASAIILALLWLAADWWLGLRSHPALSRRRRRLSSHAALEFMVRRFRRIYRPAGTRACLTS